MKKIISKPYLFFLGIIPILFIFGYLNKNQTIDIEYFGGLFSIDIWTISLFSCVFFLLISFNYVALIWTNKKPKKVLTFIHILIQTFSFGVFYYYKTMFLGVEKLPDSQLNLYLILSFLLFVIASMVHLINFFASLVSKSK